MGQTVDQIEEHMETSRENLRSNLDELGQKVKTTLDWRATFRSNPTAFLAVAFGGGFILAQMIRGSGGRADANISPGTALSTGTVESRKRQASRAWDDIQHALVGVVAAKVTNTLGAVVPGFKEQLAARAEDERVVNGARGKSGT